MELVGDVKLWPSIDKKMNATEYSEPTIALQPTNYDQLAQLSVLSCTIQQQKRAKTFRYKFISKTATIRILTVVISVYILV